MRECCCGLCGYRVSIRSLMSSPIGFLRFDQGFNQKHDFLTVYVFI